jgi:hypothetical protein
MGGAWRNDHPDNIQAKHYWCSDKKKDRQEWMADGRSVEPLFRTHEIIGVLYR